MLFFLHLRLLREGERAIHYYYYYHIIVEYVFEKLKGKLMKVLASCGLHKGRPDARGFTDNNTIDEIAVVIALIDRGIDLSIIMSSGWMDGS